MSAMMCCWISCSSEEPGTGGNIEPAGDNPHWIMKNDLVEKVSVYSGDKIVETFSYEYDEMDRTARLVRTDKTTGVIMMDISYSYDDAGGMTLSGKWGTGAKRTMYASLAEDDSSMSFKGSWNDALEYTVSLDTEGLPAASGFKYGFRSGNDEYSSDIMNSQSFRIDGEDISSIVMSTGIRTSAGKTTGAEASSGLEISYTYSEMEDVQNFNVYLVPCEFPVWYAKELPGCRHLITGMTMKRGNVILPSSFTVSYTFNDNGSIKTATRTDFSRGAPVVERVYSFSYL